MKAAVTLSLGVALGSVFFAAHAASTPPIARARGIYMERCGGCHGLNGKSDAEHVPDLADRAGYFLCDRDSRAFAGSLPNIVFARLSDEDLSEVMNYVMFDLGGPSAPANAEPFTAAELASYRAHPLAVSDLHARRQLIVEHLVAECGAPAELLAYKRPRGTIAPTSQE